MKTILISTVCAAAGFLLGFGVPSAGKQFANSQNARRSSRPARPIDPWGGQTGSAAARMRHFASLAATLAPEDWPAFFQARIGDPEGTRLAERLWAEQDPGGFWQFLKDRHDTNDLLQYGRNFLQTWAAADPDAAMAAANEITDKRTSDFLRREVIEAVLTMNLEKGLALAAAALDFNRFSSGERAWIKADPAAAAKGLSALPEASEYRGFLKIAVANWAETDPAALLDWVKRQPVPERDPWFGEAFKAAANADFPAAMDTASAIADPAARDAALAGVISSGHVPEDQVPGLLVKLSIPAREEATREVIGLANSPAQIAAATRLLDNAPASKNLLTAVRSLASRVASRDPNQSLAWAASLPDSAMRRTAYVRLAETLDYQNQLNALIPAISNAPRLDLSDDLFRNVLNHLPADRRAAWLAKLPPDLAAWANSAVPE